MSRRPRLTPAVAALRSAVRAALQPYASVDAARLVGDVGALPEPAAAPSSADAPLVLVALSGGPDSLALAAAAAFAAPRLGIVAGAVVVDHGLQPGSEQVAAAAAAAAAELGLGPVRTVAMGLGPEVRTAPGGLEAEARRARYAALAQAAADTGAVAVLTGHTLDDQAETVLLGLARGSGATSLHGMAADSALAEIAGAPSGAARLLRPLLGVRRAETLAACADQGLEPWHDPMNADPAHTRVRVRERVLPLLEAELGPGIAEALGRTAELLREDAAALDSQAEELIAELAEPAEGGLAIAVAALRANPPALRHRLLRLIAAREFGLSLSREHTLAAARLVTEWHGQRWVEWPGVRVVRQGGLLFFTTAPTDHPLAVIEHDH